ncbi:inovirus-type Gp2 protein [Superficieibacter sp. 1612_C1]|uniref:YagK/YfjJ domain-containing protein n=1 Tax=Superficieibacter sp. 1612_C1 TaxID=2780382 RepID=UPI0018837BA2|nr:inovirus-type Gp2 protein [Superficieibacter sp. 1612_C1]
MNNHYSVAAGGNASDAANTRAFLQQAVDHYPRLVAFSFTLVLPYQETMTDYRSLILRFHTEVWQRTGEYSQARQQERKNSPPTLLRWIWGSTCAPEYQMVLMMNLDTLAPITQPAESSLQAFSGIIRDAWRRVTDGKHEGVVDITPLVINRSAQGTFALRFGQLQERVKGMTLPVMTARTGVIST